MAKGTKNKLQRRFETGTARFLLWVIQQLPHRAAQRLGAGVGIFVHNVLKIRVKHAIGELLRSFPDRDEAWARGIVKGVYRHFGAMSAEMARLPVYQGHYEDVIEIDDGAIELLKESFARGKGAFVCSGHLGNWELAGAIAVQSGFPTTFVVGEQSNKEIEELLDDLRRSGGMHIVKRREAPRGIPRALKKNHLVAMMIDQDARSAGVFVPFFGRLASTFRGVALFAQKYDPTILMMNTWRAENGKIQLQLEKVDIPDTGDKEADTVALMKALTEKLEGYIRQHPDQYLWLHRRWKTRPPEEQA